MKTFTVKDFIQYNGPCFSCGSSINFIIMNEPNDGAGTTGPTTKLRPSMMTDHFTLDLVVTYNRVLQIHIFFKTNKIEVSHKEELKSYLLDNKLSLKSYCQKCYSTIQSDNLEFNLDKMFVKPITISTEYLRVNDDKKMYEMTTYHHGSPDPSTTMFVTDLSKKATASPFHLKLPHLPLWKFKTRKRFLNKIKTYLIFS